MATAQKQTEDFRIPHCRAAEVELLAGLMLDPSLACEAAAELKREDFFITAHRDIFQALIRMAGDGIAIDPVTLSEELRKEDRLESVGGIAYICELLTGMYRPTSLKRYVRLIKDASVRRRLISSSQKILTSALEGEELSDLLTDAQISIANVAEERESLDLKPLLQLSKDCLDEIDRISQRPGIVTGVPSGYIDLDRMTNGFQPTDLILLAARPSIGKSALALNIADNVSTEGKSVAFFSLEMSKESLVKRLLCSKARVDSHRVKGGFLSREEWAKLMNAHQQIADFKKPIQIDDRSTLTVPDLLLQARRFKAMQGLDLIIVDYLQLMEAHSRADTDQQRISQVSRGLKRIAKELNVPVIALCQLSRSVEQRADNKPKLSDLRESGSQEQDADLVLFIHRNKDENYGPADIIIGKQRNGPTETIQLTYISQFTRFENYKRD